MGKPSDDVSPRFTMPLRTFKIGGNRLKIKYLYEIRINSNLLDAFEGAEDFSKGKAQHGGKRQENQN